MTIDTRATAGEARFLMRCALMAALALNNHDLRQHLDQLNDQQLQNAENAAVAVSLHASNIRKTREDETTVTITPDDSRYREAVERHERSLGVARAYEPMPLADVPDELLAPAVQAWEDNSSSRPGSWTAEGQVRAVLAAALPHVRAWVADEIEDEPADPNSEYARGLNVAAQLARGDAP